VANQLARRVASIFLPDKNGRRPCHGEDTRWTSDPHWRNLVLFNEYFHAETGKGLGASHQTGWTALVIRHLQDFGSKPENTGGLSQNQPRADSISDIKPRSVHTR